MPSSPTPSFHYESSAALLAQLHGELSPEETSLLRQKINDHPALAKEAEELRQVNALLKQAFASRGIDPACRLTLEQRTNLMELISHSAQNKPAPEKRCRRWNVALVWTGGLAAAAMVTVAFLWQPGSTGQPPHRIASKEKQAGGTMVSLPKPDKSSPPKARPAQPGPPAPGLDTEKNLAHEAQLPPVPKLSPLPPKTPAAMAENPRPAPLKAEDGQEGTPKAIPEKTPAGSAQPSTRVLANPLPRR